MNIFTEGLSFFLWNCRDDGGKIKDLSTSQVNQILKVVESLGYVLANDLRRLTLLSKQRLVSIKSYRGLRRKKGFPVRGQRTHTNARTAKKVR